MAEIIYLIGSLRCPKIPQIALVFRGAGHEVVDDWHSGGPDADDAWKRYEVERKRPYAVALEGLYAQHVFEFDMRHIERATVGVLVLPAGRSAHLELGHMLGRGKRGFVLFEEEPETDRWDLMYKLATGVAFSADEIVEKLK